VKYVKYEAPLSILLSLLFSKHPKYTFFHHVDRPNFISESTYIYIKVGVCIKITFFHCLAMSCTCSYFRIIYGLDDRGSRVRFPAGAGNFPLYHRVQKGSRIHPASYPMGIRSSEADHSAPSSAEVKECVELYLHSAVRLSGLVLSLKKTQGKLYLCFSHQWQVGVFITCCHLWVLTFIISESVRFPPDFFLKINSTEIIVYLL
jgi:hypothetical protein